MAARVRRTLNFSMPISCLPWRRIPAVSSSSIACPWYCRRTRLTSRVVPARLATMACCLPASVLNRLDLPTFGRPIRAILRVSLGSTCFLAGMCWQISLRMSAMPELCSAEVRMIDLIPRRKNSLSGRLPFRSILLVMRMTGLRLFRAVLATRRSSSLGYLVLSTTTRMTSAASAASVIWSWMLASNSSSAGLRPAVSTSQNSRPLYDALPMTLSRVVPASRATMACCERMMRLNSELLPVLARPIIATVGSLVAIINLIITEVS